MNRVQVQPGQYSYRLELWQGTDRRVHELRLARADFNRAVEATFFDGLRRGRFTDYEPPFDLARIEPRFAGNGPSPHTHGFRVALPTPAGGDHRLAFDTTFFTNLVRRASAQLVAAGRVPNNSILQYQLTAYLDTAETKPLRGLSFDLESAPTAIPIRGGSRKALGPAEAWDGPGDEDFPVLLPRQVIHEAVAEARRAPDREVGGVLLGHLRRDDETGELFLEITCMVPAEETQASEVSITFTPATWARVREVIDWRGEGEIFVGWVHSHPFRFCAECRAPAPLECVAKVLFYSLDDEFLMELSLARPFMVGLLSAVEPLLEPTLGHAPVRLFGWKHGGIVNRGFHVIDT
jgi:proteasome lid subunit RPN8/RPN11